MDQNQFPLPCRRYGQHWSRILSSRYRIIERMCLRKRYPCPLTLQIKLQGIHQRPYLHSRILNLINQNPWQQLTLRSPNHQQRNQRNWCRCYYLSHDHHSSSRHLGQLHCIRKWIPKRSSWNLRLRYLHSISQFGLQPNFQLVWQCCRFLRLQRIRPQQQWCWFPNLHRLERKQLQVHNLEQLQIPLIQLLLHHGYWLHHLQRISNPLGRKLFSLLPNQLKLQRKDLHHLCCFTKMERNRMYWQMWFRQSLERFLTSMCLPSRSILEWICLHHLSKWKNLERQH